VATIINHFRPRGKVDVSRQTDAINTPAYSVGAMGVIPDQPLERKVQRKGLFGMVIKA